jgi:hypothetical protein
VSRGAPATVDAWGDLRSDPWLVPRLREDLGRRLWEDARFRLAGVAPLAPETLHVNRLLRLRAADGRGAVAKIYRRDDRGRLGREFNTLTFLRRLGVACVPEPYLRSDAHGYAVYSLEPGATTPAAAWPAEAVEALAGFAAVLHRVRSGDPGAEFPPAYWACFSSAEYAGRVRERLGRFRVAAAAPDAPAEVRVLCAALDPAAAVERLLAGATAGLAPADLEARLPEADRRLSTGDFAPHNVLVRPAGHPAGPICVVDLELAGWDDPLAPLAGFLTADSALDLPPAHAARFLRAYREAAGAPAPAFARLGRVCALLHVNWCSVHLALLTPDRVAARRFGYPDMDVSAHLAEQIAKFRRRLRLAERAVEGLIIGAEV